MNNTFRSVVASLGGLCASTAMAQSSVTVYGIFAAAWSTRPTSTP
ncbi:hypothetical protein [Janthinobacterium sp. HLX7-2]